jgi:hypothetical protein
MTSTRNPWVSCVCRKYQKLQKYKIIFVPPKNVAGNVDLYVHTCMPKPTGEKISPNLFFTIFKGLGAIRAKIGPTSDVDNIFS